MFTLNLPSSTSCRKQSPTHPISNFEHLTHYHAPTPPTRKYGFNLHSKLAHPAHYSDLDLPDFAHPAHPANPPYSPTVAPARAGHVVAADSAPELEPAADFAAEVGVVLGSSDPAHPAAVPAANYPQSLGSHEPPKSSADSQSASTAVAVAPRVHRCYY